MEPLTSTSLSTPRSSRIDEVINSIHRGNIEEIFNIADKLHANDYVRGEVYVGTSSLKDISDEISFKQFVEQYIDTTEAKVTKNENGNWLKVIDNDGDGVVDYVLRTDFVMTTITDYEKRTDVYDVEWMGGLPNGNGEGKIPASAIIKASEDTDLSVGSVILYTLIDGITTFPTPLWKL